MLVSVPELTRSADIKLNTRLRPPPAVAIVSSPQLRGVPTAIHRTRAIRGRRLPRGAAAPPKNGNPTLPRSLQGPFALKGMKRCQNSSARQPPIDLTMAEDEGPGR